MRALRTSGGAAPIIASGTRRIPGRTWDGLLRPPLRSGPVDAPARFPGSHRVQFSMLTPADAATSLRRNPGTRR
jgi:hypothetical protein